MGNSKNRSRPRKRRFSANQFPSRSTAEECSSDDEVQAAPSVARAPASASEKKLMNVPQWILDGTSSSDSDGSMSSDSSDVFGEGEQGGNPLTSGYRLVDLEVLQSIFSSVAICRFCKIGDLQLKESSRSGLASTLLFVCNSCGEQFESPIVEKTGHFFDCNRRSVLAARVVGCGYADLQKCCGIMNLPPPVAESNFTLHQSATIKAAISVGESSMRRAAAEVRELNAQHEPPLTTAVTYDGTWMRRGFTSLFGVFPCIHWGTGRVLDMAVFSKYCHACATWKARMELGTIIADEFQTWQASHDGQCSANTLCCAPAMEAEAAVLLWNRSRELNGLE